MSRLDIEGELSNLIGRHLGSALDGRVGLAEAEARLIGPRAIWREKAVKAFAPPLSLCSAKDLVRIVGGAAGV